jgi:NAD(P)-dependent dehydrogenase (short-subunit alcohol dehydrogenase family)
VRRPEDGEQLRQASAKISPVTLDITNPAHLAQLPGALGGRLDALVNNAGIVISGAYAASKFALEGLADALRVELRPWGIRVSLVEPGSIDTDLWRNVDQTVDEVEAGLSAEHRQLYRKQIGAMRKLSARIAKQAAPPDRVTAAVAHALSATRPRVRYLVGPTRSFRRPPSPCFRCVSWMWPRLASPVGADSTWRRCPSERGPFVVGVSVTLQQERGRP